MRRSIAVENRRAPCAVEFKYRFNIRLSFKNADNGDFICIAVYRIAHILPS